ncbi:hypothetical protein [Aeoliella mucimassa]|uniref:PEP-CTERM sorting domain-containing protein n=1 Tax=Aeoliella mucimassa TaxID=2527972 RepID=A0A518AP63_9BACT|nr:hypothetical protein [Aeoliella mucimassa]QDU56520.1 hypothetical protein Pan181_27300 [Aeoliella mucimassa]
MICKKRQQSLRWCLASAVALISLGSGLARAEILVSDNFSSIGSGVGWAENSAWGNLSSLEAGVLEFVDSGVREFAEPIDVNAIGQIYMALDFTQITPGDGTYWGGFTVWEADWGEAIFYGNPWGGENGLSDLGVATNASNVAEDPSRMAPYNVLHTGVDLDGTLQSSILEITLRNGLVEQLVTNLRKN